ncbi:MAG: insulinase family protein, partial [Bacteroidetes bacterium]|nr:insulinase family protein [Bacteroidota bacterium]
MSRYKKTVLPTGIRIITETIPHVKSFSLGFWFNVGSRDENQTNNGISHVIEHMLFKGTKTRSAKQIAEEVEWFAIGLQSMDEQTINPSGDSNSIYSKDFTSPNPAPTLRVRYI